MSEDSSHKPTPPAGPGEVVNFPGEAVTFKEFAMAIQGGDMSLTGRMLSQLTGISAEAGLSAATFFSQKLESEPGSFMKLMQIRSEIQTGNNNAAMMLIMECFNVDGMPAMQALESMKKLG